MRFINKESDNNSYRCFTGVHLKNWNSLLLLSVNEFKKQDINKSSK